MMHLEDARRAPFDQQAKTYEKRAGLSKPVCVSIAETINNICALSPDDVVLEIGCGTGQIGGLLDKLPSQYVGFDVSAGMLNQFRLTFPDKQGALIHADGRKMWPLANNQAKVIFASRALHWINIEHIVKEAYRVTQKNKGYLLVGRIERSLNCWEKQLRKQLHKLLRENGLQPLDGQQHLKQLTQALTVKGAQALEPISVYTWKSNRDVLSAIQNWKEKEGLSGTLPSSELKRSVLFQLQQWAEENFGVPLPSGTEQSYIIYGFKI